MYTYCEVRAKSESSWFGTPKVTIDVDFGQGDPSIFASIFKGKSNVLKDSETGQVKKFNSVIDALNYMSSQGWEFINSLVITEGKQNIYHYILRKNMDI